MTKRFLIILSALLLLALPAFAASRSYDSSMYLLYDGNTLLGPAVLFMEKDTLLTTAVLPENTTVFTARQGETEIEASLSAVTEDGILSMLTLAQPSAGRVAELSEYLVYDQNPYWGLDREGETHTGNIDRADYAVASMDVLSLTCEENLLPGTVILDSRGNLAGLVYATLGEGEGRYLALTSYGIYNVFQEGSDTEQAEVDTSLWYTELEAALDQNLLTLSWKGEEDAQESDTSFVYSMDLKNSYYTVHTVDEGEHTMQFLLVPGHSYAFWVAKQYDENPNLLNITPAYIEIPLAGKATEYDFETVSMGLAILPASDIPGDMDALQETEAITQELLEDPDQTIYLQIKNTYVVEEEVFCNLLIALTPPDGSSYTTISGFLYSPDYMNNDLWHIDITSLFRDCASFHEGLPEGNYTITYYLDDKEAGSMMFTLP